MTTLILDNSIAFSSIAGLSTEKINAMKRERERLARCNECTDNCRKDEKCYLLRNKLTSPELI